MQPAAMNLSQIPISIASQQGASNIYNLLMKPKHIISEVRKKSCFIVRMFCRKPPDCCCKLRHCWISLLHSNKRWKDKWLTWLFEEQNQLGCITVICFCTEEWLIMCHRRMYFPGGERSLSWNTVTHLEHKLYLPWNFKQLFFFLTAFFSRCWKKSRLEGALHLMNF